MEFYPIDFVLHIINIVVLFVLVRSIAYKPIRKFMLAREEKVKNQLAEAEQAKADAEALKAEYDARLAGAEADCAALRSEKLSAADAEKQQLLAEAKERAAGIVSEAERTAEARAQKTMAEARTEIAHTAVELAGRVLCFDEVARARAMQMDVSLSGEAEGLVKVTGECTADELAGIKTCLENLTGKHLTLRTETDDKLLGGFVGFIEGKVYDFSYAAQLNALQQSL